MVELLGKAKWASREWCRIGHVLAQERPCERGNGAGWMIFHNELQRTRNEGFLPVSGYRHPR
jgi:hypothetical protein